MVTDRLNQTICDCCGRSAGELHLKDCIYSDPYRPRPTPLTPPSKTKSDGSSTDYYALPAEATDLLDLIEHKKMSFALGNIFKACYRLGEKHGTDLTYDLNKIIFFAERMKQQIKNN